MVGRHTRRPKRLLGQGGAAQRVQCSSVRACREARSTGHGAAAVAGAMVAKLRGGGQACTAANRFYVRTDVVGAFTDRLACEVERLTVGPASEGCAIGPLISAAAVRRLQQAVDGAVADGARVAARAVLPEARGHFFAPTVLADAPLLRDEQSGPVAPVVAWDDEAALLRSWPVWTCWMPLGAGARCSHAGDELLAGTSRCRAESRSACEGRATCWRRPALSPCAAPPVAKAAQWCAASSARAGRSVR